VVNIGLDITNTRGHEILTVDFMSDENAVTL
jgi:hypothetical protein